VPVPLLEEEAVRRDIAFRHLATVDPAVAEAYAFAGEERVGEETDAGGERRGARSLHVEHRRRREALRIQVERQLAERRARLLHEGERGQLGDAAQRLERGLRIV